MYGIYFDIKKVRQKGNVLSNSEMATSKELFGLYTSRKQNNNLSEKKNKRRLVQAKYYPSHYSSS